MRKAKFFYIFIFVLPTFYLKLTAQTQPGFYTYPLPSNSQYTIQKKLDLKEIGPELPFAEPSTVIYGDDLTITNLQIRRYGDIPINTLIVSDIVRLGEKNVLSMLSLNKGINEREGGSFIIICRKLIISSESNLKFVGSAGAPQAYNTIERPYPTFTGSYGALLLIAAEQVEIGPEVENKVRTTLLNAAKLFFDDMAGTYTKQPFPMLLLRNQEVMSVLNTYKHLLPSEDVMSFQAMFNSNKIVDSRVISAILKLLDIELRQMKEEERFYSLFMYDKNRLELGKLFSNIPIHPPSPFFSVEPFYTFYNNQNKFYLNSDQALPFIIGMSPAMSMAVRPFLTKKVDGQYVFSSMTVFPACKEVIGASIGFNALRTLSTAHHKLFSQWLVAWIRYKKAQAEQAQGLENRAKYFDILREVAEMPRYQLDDPDEDQYNGINQQMLAKLREAKNVVSEKQIVLDAQVAGVMGKPVTLFAQGIPYKYYLPPTEVLINGVHANNNWYYGILKNVNTDERLTRLTFQGELQIDPFIAAVVHTKLLTTEQSALQPGLLPGIQYQLNSSTGEGIKRFTATINGSVATINLDIDPEELGSVVYRLATTGLPYYLKWTLPGDPVQQGQLNQPLFLRLSRRSGGHVHVNGMQLTNEESTGSAMVHYIQTSTGRILPIKEVKVEAGKTVTLTGIDLQANEYLIDVPDMGITYDDGGADKAVTRFLVDAGQVIDHIIVSNKIPASISLGNSGLSYPVENVEVDIALVNTGTNATPPFAHLILSPQGHYGAIRPAVQMPRPATLSNTYRVTGKVNFRENLGSAPLKSIDVTSPLIDITIDQMVLPIR